MDLRIVMLLALLSACSHTQPKVQDPAVEDHAAAGETMPRTKKGASKSPAPAPAPAAAAAAQSKASSEEASTSYIVNIDFLNVRKGPGMKFEVIDKIRKGAEINVESFENAIWAKIGPDRYVSKSFISPK